MKYFRKIVGEKCYLSPINVNDLEIYTKWLNDLGVVKYLSFHSKMISLLTEKEALEKLSGGQSYAIITKERDELIGNCGLMDIDHLNRNCEAGIFIGNKDYWGKGYGTEALSLLISYSINYLNIRNFILRVYSFNTRAIKSYKKIGFKEIGRRRKSLIMENREYDIVYMDLLAEEFLEKR
ncbi:MAG: GNAT family N-acetyltransferase [Spirochaetales bacterium]|nr:GNAT family N-acetyltransferase [Spirochaetales bacterium]